MNKHEKKEEIKGENIDNNEEEEKGDDIEEGEELEEECEEVLEEEGEENEEKTGKKEITEKEKEIAKEKEEEEKKKEREKVVIKDTEKTQKFDEQKNNEEKNNNLKNINNLKDDKNKNKNEREIIRIDNNKNYDENMIKDYYGKKGIIKRTIGIGKVNVKVYEDDKSESNDENFISIINGNLQSNIDNNSNYLNNILNNSSNNKSLSNNISNYNNLDKSYISYNIPNSGQLLQSEMKSTSILNEAKELKNYPKESKNKNNNNSNKKKPIIYNIDNKKFIVKVNYYFEYNTQNQKYINIILSTIYPGSQIIHWAIYTSKTPKKWTLPPKSHYPKLTKELDNALETEFYSSSEKEERIISIYLPRKLNNKESIEGIYFVVYDPIKNIWYNNFGKNFKIKFNS